jgi:hypothetical protein
MTRPTMAELRMIVPAVGTDFGKRPGTYVPVR